MILKQYFNKEKLKMFPEVKDWKNPKPEIRYSNNVKDMNFYDWLWFHPSAYKLIHFGYPILCVVMFLALGIITYLLHWTIGGIIPIMSVLFSGFFVWDFIKKYKQRSLTSNMTLADVYMVE